MEVPWRPESWLTRALGVFLLATVAWRRLRAGGEAGYPVQRFALFGGAFAFVSALLGSAGPFLAPFRMALGLHESRDLDRLASPSSRTGTGSRTYRRKAVPRTNGGRKAGED